MENKTSKEQALRENEDSGPNNPMYYEPKLLRTVKKLLKGDLQYKKTQNPEEDDKKKKKKKNEDQNQGSKNKKSSKNQFRRFNIYPK